MNSHGINDENLGRGLFVSLSSLSPGLTIKQNKHMLRAPKEEGHH